LRAWAWAGLFALLGASAALVCAEETPVPEAGVVEIASAAPASDDGGWKPVEEARGSTRFAAALDGWLKVHPHGVQAARALYEQAQLQDNLLEAGATLRRARGEGPGSLWGAKASLALARLEYDQERTESALMALEDADAWPRSEDMEPDWLYWRAQCRLVQKGFERAKADFERLIAVYPKDPRIPSAILGLADCDAALKLDDKALAGFAQLYQDPQNPFGAQALWGAAMLQERAQHSEEARRLLERLRQQYPASFEARAVPERLQALAQAPQPTPVPAIKHRPAAAKRAYVQVGAFSKRAGALRFEQQLKKRRYPVQVQVHKLANRTLYHVRVGPYPSLAKAQAAAKRLKTREHLPFVQITEE
jgi:tetratricopeptide (TPR) repeat protein